MTVHLFAFYMDQDFLYCVIEKVVSTIFYRYFFKFITHF